MKKHNVRLYLENFYEQTEKFAVVKKTYEFKCSVISVQPTVMHFAYGQIPFFVIVSRLVRGVDRPFVVTA